MFLATEVKSQITTSPQIKQEKHRDASPSAVA